MRIAALAATAALILTPQALCETRLGCDLALSSSIITPSPVQLTSLVRESPQGQPTIVSVFHASYDPLTGECDECRAREEESASSVSTQREIALHLKMEE